MRSAMATSACSPTTPWKDILRPSAAAYPGRRFEHKTLRSGPLDLTLDLASVTPDAIAEFINKHLRRTR